ncbi:MAG: chromosomal replication initiator protein DnaA, partial [Candidatus Latescibacteria bacterium]|nr:chromosomal replication initiator protein DnaA [Candidatus Latescibacterota bacterium]
ARQLNSEEAVFEVPNSFFADWLEENYAGLIASTIQDVLAWKPRVAFAVGETIEPERVLSGIEHASETMLPESPYPAQAQVSTLPVVESEKPQPIFPLNPRYRFDNFIVGESNEVSFSVAMAVAESPGQTAFNPLVLYGGVGLGKTHLLQAIGTHCIESGTAERVAYVTAEKFFSDYLEGVSKQDTSEFYGIYRNADVLLVDDIQFYVKTEGCQRELIHTFNALFQADKQIILSSDRPPSHLKGFEDRLISRFQWGLVTNIEAPDLPTRVAILMQKAEEMGVSLSHEIASFLAEQIDTNIRELEGALKRLLAFTKLQGYPLTIETAQNTLLNRPKKTRPTISIEGIQKAAADFFEIPLEKLVGATRKEDITAARHVSMYLSKSLTGAPLKTIGIQFGNRDHTTVIHACRSVEKKISTDPRFEHLVTQLQDHIVG